MAVGKVKWFNDSKGFGFIERGEGDDVFVHYTEIEGSGYRSFNEGERVSFEVAPRGTRGPRAVNVRKAG